MAVPAPEPAGDGFRRGWRKVQGMEAERSRPGDGKSTAGRPAGGSDREARRRLINWTGLLLILFSLVWITSFYSYGGWEAMLILAVEVVVVVLLLWLLHHHRRLAIWCGHGITGLLLLGVAVSNYATGGLSGANMAAFLLVPVVAQICVGPAGVWWLVPTLAVAGGMEWAALAGFEFPNLVPPEHRHFDETMTWMGVLLVLALIVYSYERVRARWERELESQRDRAREAATARSRFLANMSHEFRTPLNVILGNCNLLADDCREGRDRHRLELIGKNTYALLGLVEDALDMAKMEAGGLEIHVAPFEPGQVVEDVVRSMQGRLEERDQQLQVEDRRGQPRYVRGDAFRLRQILLNLLDNIIKFAVPGRVTIRLRNEPLGWLVVEVEDSGPGIPRQDWEKVFRPFFQRQQDSGERGVGLGLAICRQVAESLGGRISLQEHEGRGCRFVLRLPFPHWENKEKTASGTRPGPLLIVEDDSASRELMETILQGAGYRVLLAATGGEALRLLGERQCCLALVDINLPDMDGLEIARRVRAREGQQEHVVLVALTANALPEQREACFAAGMDDFVTKPIEAARLIQLVGSWVDTPAVSSQAG